MSKSKQTLLPNGPPRKLPDTPYIDVIPLGAGQDVGRSCILININKHVIMLDCGMHMGYSDDRRFPDFNQINIGSNLTRHIDCVIISHFHLDHCGSLPFFTEMIGYDGPVYMTYPTKSIAPVLLEDYRKIQVEYKGDSNFFTTAMIKACMRKCIPIDLEQVVDVLPDLKIQPFYAGHVLGAAMFLITSGGHSVLYTGDYNMTPDRHLGAAHVSPGLKPDLLISESTYASTIRDCKRARERDFLKKVHEAVKNGGKVLIPVFALGRAQELCILLESYWDRLKLDIPIFISAGLAEKANQYYRLFINWTNENIKNTFSERNMFDFKHIRPFDNKTAESPGPMVLFSTPGMLHGGQSLQVFKKWCEDEKNMIIMPGYCVAGTVGSRVVAGEKRIQIDDRTYDIKLQVQYMSFSAHADAKGITQLIRQVEPRNVMFVHGENAKMEFLKARVEKEFHINVYKPANGERVTILVPELNTFTVPRAMYQQALATDSHPHKRVVPFEAAIQENKDNRTVELVPVNGVIEDEYLYNVTYSEYVKVESVDWAHFSKKLRPIDPDHQIKDDGLDLFCSSILLTHGEEDDHLEVIFDISRTATLDRIYRAIGAVKCA
uniref:Integrator complex subunit 11 n=1 Tax=Panagrellus redivivus TaxID=6233 RepID=A0A7E4W0U2_PANRE